ncbi:hypothetical protein P3T73_13905 [Kiritimatiellota bacterium B12222]|nr:hypothetical protein P3T73_13905 [Kiritimatiellota bacterium B12222]
MYRDYEGKGSGADSSLGILLHATGELGKGWDAGGTYIYAEDIYTHNQYELLGNNGFNLLNEAWIRYGAGEELMVEAGRFVYNAEVFRRNDSRQKPRAIEGVHLKWKGVDVGHAFQMSNYLQKGDMWEFNDFDEVFHVDADSVGVSWVEWHLVKGDELDWVIFDALAWDITNLLGTRMTWSFSDSQALTAYVRIETGVEADDDHGSESYGLTLNQKVGSVMFEPGVFVVEGDNLLFKQSTTGIHHTLEQCLLTYTNPFDGGSDSLYLKVSTAVAQTKLSFLGIYTHQGPEGFDAGEVDFIVKQPLVDDLDLAFKCGFGYRDFEDAANTTATDLRLFFTYHF